MITKHFNTKTNVLEVSYTGTVSTKELLEYLHNLENDKVLPRNLKIFTDSSNFISTRDTTDVKIVAEAYRKVLMNYTFIISAFFTDNPRPTALTTMYKLQMIGLPNYQFDIFCTKEAALKFLLS
ncbi:MAG: hypothetical protein WCL51_05730 [Bacteroidota bacterium]